MTLERGIVMGVDYSNGVITCDVQGIRTENPHSALPVQKPFSGIIRPPRVGEVVTMEKTADGQRVVTGVIARREETPDNVAPGEYHVQLDADSYVRFVETDAGYRLEVSASDEVRVDSPGNVLIDGVDFDEHTHEFEDSTIEDTDGGGGGESTETKTTSGPQNP